MSYFQSNYTNRLDKKGRVSIPAPFRDVLSAKGESVIYARASDRKPMIECFGQDWAEKRQTELNALDSDSDEYRELALAFHATTLKLAFDGEGRVLLPAPLVTHAGLAEQVLFLGAGDRFEIWEPAAGQADLNDILTRKRARATTPAGRA